MKTVHAILLFAALTGAATCLLTREYIYVSVKLNWVDAQAYCRKNYVDLSTISSDVELSNFKKDVANSILDDSWIGLSRTLNSTDFTQWSDGSIVEYTVWKPGEPKKSGNFLCVYMFDSAFAVQGCERSQPFSCYKWVPQITIVKKNMDWDKALDYCRTYYTDLASLSNNQDLLVSKTMMTNPTLSLWIGLRFMDGQWFWVNQDPLENLTSVPSCPIKPLHCGALKATYILENRNCNEENNFICY